MPWAPGVFAHGGAGRGARQLANSPARAHCSKPSAACDALTDRLRPPWAAMPHLDRFGPGAPLAAEADPGQACGSVGSYGWSGEATDDLLEAKLRGRAASAFALPRPSRVKFSPDGATLQRLEETGTGPGEGIAESAAPAGKRGSPRWPQPEPQQHRGAWPVARICSARSRVGSHPPRRKASRVVEEVAMVRSSWVSQASFHPRRAFTVAGGQRTGPLEPCCIPLAMPSAQRCWLKGARWAEWKTVSAAAFRPARPTSR